VTKTGTGVSSAGDSMDQLLRLLHLIPAATRDEGVSYSALAEDLGVDHATIEADLRALLDRSVYMTAGQPGDLQAEIGPDRVRIWTPGPFGRPPRLNRGEALALVLGLRSRALLRGQPEERETQRLLARLEGALGAHGPPDPTEFPVEDASAAAAGGSIRDQALDAVGDRRTVDFTYLRPGDPAPARRRLQPAAVVHAEGRWYLLGCDPEAAGGQVAATSGGDAEEVAESALPPGFRAFRLDRVLELSETDERFPPWPEDLLAALASESRLFFPPLTGEPVPEVSVVYSPRIVRWIRERHDGETLPDGSFRVVHRVADRDWLVRHVLQYAGEARAEGEAAAWIRDALEPKET
jgi:predicted DNA-binding transcriptional regulator YafY